MLPFIALTASTSTTLPVVTWPKNDKPWHTAEGKPSKTMSLIAHPVTVTALETVEFEPTSPKFMEAVVVSVLGRLW
jgi:hypothetical protein